MGGLGEPLLHLHHQGGAAGHQSRVVAVAGQHLQRVVQRRRVMELEIYHQLPGRRHRRLPFPRAAAATELMMP